MGLNGGDLPLPLGGGVAVGVPPTDVDVMIDRVPFWLSITENTPYQRETADYQREQVDQAPEAGEQSLAGWWTRSQMSWHLGAGLDYLDTTARPDEADRLRYKTSYNVDPWTPGVLKRLNGTATARSSASTQVWVEPTDTGVVVATTSKVEVFDGTWVERSYGSALAIRAFAIDGESFYVATVDGVYTAPLAGTAVGTKVYDLPSTDVPITLGWAKQRLMLGHGPRVHVLDVAGPALPAAKFTHPTAGWRWTSFCDSPSAIVAAGYAGSRSGLYKLELKDTNDTPTLGPGIALATMPAGERINAAFYYLGSLLILGTSRGLRVCSFDGFYSTFTLGPLTVEHPVSSLGGYDRFVYGGCLLAGKPSCLRVDLGAPVSDAGHYAWAPDLPMPAVPSGFAFRSDGRKWIGVPNHGLLEELTTPATGEAWLETARIRMATVEDKHFVHGTLRGVYSVGAPIRVEGTTDGATWRALHTATASAERFPLRVARAEWLALRFHLDGAAQLSSYQVQALPAGKRQRLIQLPVSVADYQQTRSGVEVGYPGWGRTRLNEVEVLEEAGAAVTITAPALFPESFQGVIERMTYLQSQDSVQGSGLGGLLQIVVRTTS